MVEKILSKINRNAIKQISSKINNTVKFVLTFLIGMFFALASYKVYLSCAGNIGLMFCYREAFVGMFCVFALANVFIDYKVLYNFIFKYRYALAFIAFIVLVAAKINFSSIAMYNSYIQPGSGSEFINPIFGQPQPIRSDEWAVSTPRSLTYQYCAGEKYNDLIMATATNNLQASGILLSPAMLARPVSIGFLFLGPEYAVSFQWCATLMVTLLGAIELFYIVSNKKPLLAVMGGVAVAFSSFCVWWSGCALLAYGMAATAGIYNFLNAKSFKKRIICGIAVAVFGAAYVCVLYPAWLVPTGYIFLAIIVWSFISNRDNVKGFKSVDWIIFAATLVIAVTIIAFYYIAQLEYAQAISSTVYPGSRREYGSDVIKTAYFYPASLAFRFKSINGSFPFSEYGSFFSLFPIPMLLSLFVMIRRKKADLLSILLLVVSLVLTLYCTIGLPKIVATIILMSFSTAKRTIVILEFLQLILLVRSMALMVESNVFVPKKIAFPIAAIYAYKAVDICDKNFVFPDYMSKKHIIVATILIFVFVFCFIGNIKEKIKNAVIVMFIGVICYSTAFVLPIQKGLDAIYTKPVAGAISNIVKDDPDAKWVAVDQWVESNFYAACGARVINSTNYMPNLEFWELLFPNGEYNEVYNRFCHLTISLTEDESSAVLNVSDSVTLKLNYSQLDDIGAKYLIAKREITIPTDYNIDLKLLYAENGRYIYEVNYH